MKKTHMVALALAAASLSCSGKPCAGSSCIGVAGTYVVTYTPSLDCALWAYHPAPTSSMVITQSGSAIQVTLEPSIESPTHTLPGTLFTDGTIQATEPALNATLGIPYATLTGSFQSQPGGLFFTGSMNFTQPGVTGADAGPNNGCGSTVTVNAQRTGTDTTVVIPDGGPVPDGGSNPDGGSGTATDGGDGGP